MSTAIDATLAPATRASSITSPPHRPLPTRMLHHEASNQTEPPLRVRGVRPHNVRDDLVLSQPTIDSHHRVGLGRLATKLDWEPGDQPVLTIRGHSIHLERPDSSTATRTRSTGIHAGYYRYRHLDQQRRITLPSAAFYALGARPGQQVQAIADLGEESIVLTSLPRVLDLILSSLDDDQCYPQDLA